MSMITKSIQVKNEYEIIFDNVNSKLTFNDTIDVIPNETDLIELENLQWYEHLLLTEMNFNEILFNFIIQNFYNILVEPIVKPYKIAYINPTFDNRQYLLDELDFNAEDTIEVFKQEYCGEDGWYTRLNKPTFC